MEYTAVIRTLGKAGEKYKQLLLSLAAQSMQPESIIVYIAEGYDIPEETIGSEQYVYVKKGMLAQRANQYNEVNTEYILFLDDDLYLPPDFVKKMYSSMVENGADVISPDIFPNNERSIISECLMTISGRMRARRHDNTWGYKVMRTAGYSYNQNPPKNGVRWSQTNAGACFLCRKESFLNIHLEDELWIDNTSYPIGEDQIMYYKMSLMGLKQLTLYGSGIEHLDAGGNLGSKDKERNLIYSDYRFRIIFWHRFIVVPDKNCLSRFWSVICLIYFIAFGCFISVLRMRWDILRVKIRGVKDGRSFIKSEAYSSLASIVKING